MTDQAKTLAVLGASSGLAHAYLRLMTEQGRFDQYVLLGRSADKLGLVRDDIEARSGKPVRVIQSELAEPAQIVSTMSKILETVDHIDECVICYGTLGEQGLLQNDQAALQQMLNTNFVSIIMWMEAVAKFFETQNFGQLIVVGSVAGDRGRQSNYLYGATKGALERACEGMAHRFAKAKHITITLVKPGFMITPMTDGMKRTGPLWSSAEKVAKIMRKAADKKRVRVYAPWYWRYILMIVRALPIPIFHKTKM